MIKAICFDLDGVYFTPTGMDSFKKKIIDMGVSFEDMEHVLFKSDKMKKLKSGLLTDEEFWSFANSYWKLNKTMKEWLELLVSDYEINADVDKTLDTIRANGYKSLICSNNYASRINSLNDKFDFLKKFDTIVLSFQAGVTKPDKRIFEILVEKSGCTPEEIIYSDDSESKLAGANELGINTFVYLNFEQFKQELITLGVKF